MKTVDCRCIAAFFVKASLSIVHVKYTRTRIIHPMGTVTAIKTLINI